MLVWLIIWLIIYNFFLGIFWYKMNSVIAFLYFNGRVYEENDGIIFEDSKKVIQINRGMSYNALKKNRRNGKVRK